MAVKPPLVWRVKRKFAKLRWRIYQQVIGWELFRPDLNGLPGGWRGMTVRVKPIGWRRLLRGRIDAGSPR